MSTLEITPIRISSDPRGKAPKAKTSKAGKAAQLECKRGMLKVLCDRPDLLKTVLDSAEQESMNSLEQYPFKEEPPPSK